MDIIKKVTKDAERLLKSLRAKYYIELPDGAQIWHELEGYELVESQPDEPERKRRANRTGKPFGATVAYYKPFLEDAKKAGDIAVIPFSDFNPEYLRGAICAHCTQFWGKGTYTSVMNRAKGQVEVMRLRDASQDAHPNGKLSKSQEKRIAAQAQPETKATGGGTSKFRTVGHGMDALASLQFDDPEPK